MSCDCRRCQLLTRLPWDRDDPAAPLPAERWLVAERDDWPWWLLGGLLVLLALFHVPSTALTLLLLAAGAAVGSVPFLREELDGCRRVTAG